MIHIMFQNIWQKIFQHIFKEMQTSFKAWVVAFINNCYKIKTKPQQNTQTQTHFTQY